MIDLLNWIFSDVWHFVGFAFLLGMSYNLIESIVKARSNEPVMINCAEVCAIDSHGIGISLIAHYEYRMDSSGGIILACTRYTDGSGVVVDTSSMNVKAGRCKS